MLSVIIPTLNAEKSLTRTLNCLISAAVSGLIGDVTIVDGGSTDGTEEIADAAGADFISSPKGRGSQLSAGGDAASGDWLLFLHADTVLGPGWEEEVRKFVGFVEAGRFKSSDMVAAFKFTLDDFSLKARFLERMVALRCILFGLPYGDQGLIISRAFYEKLGGYNADLPLMEDVDLIRRIKRSQLVLLRSNALTSPERYVKSGFFARSCRNLFCLALFYLRVSPKTIAKIYG
ncbi:MAG: TIGR04283 family arsenosugar biosynthesis glycosyltransferase [Parvibaculaceae bacterium]|nr:TIGR04283 family arsenosugar biosynthesis glycosyltransferase [Parvibaculaceae bacterium]